MSIKFEPICGPFPEDDRCAHCWQPLNDCLPVSGHLVDRIGITHLGHHGCNAHWLLNHPYCSHCFRAEQIPNGPRYLFPKELSAVGIFMRDLNRLPVDIRCQLIKFASSVNELISSGEVGFADIVQLSQEDRMQVLTHSKNVVRLLKDGIPWVDLMDLPTVVRLALMETD